METIFIVNPEASSIEAFADLVADAADREGVTVETSEQEGHAETLTRHAADRGVDRIVAVGGDGTINEVVNGMVSAGAEATLGILPAGTGNDTARSLDLPLDPVEAFAVAQATGVERSIDLLCVGWEGGEQYAINAVNGGYAPEVADDITSDMKDRYGPLAYLAAAPKAWREAESHETTIEWDDGTREALDAVALIATNGRTIGGGFRVSPASDPGDGQFEVFCVRLGSTVDMAGVAARLSSGTLAESEAVIHRSTRRLRFQTRPPMRFTLDGEPLEVEVRRIDLVPGALDVLVPAPDTPGPS